MFFFDNIVVVDTWVGIVMTQADQKVTKLLLFSHEISKVLGFNHDVIE